MLDGKDIRLQRRKVVALLAYLAVTGQSHSRDALTNLFYPRQDRSRALSDFRQTLSHLRSTIGADWLRVDRNRIALVISRGLWSDVYVFRSLTKEIQVLGPGKDRSEPEHLLAEAARLYRGDFLAGFYLKDSPAFEDWQYFQQENLRQEYASVLERLVELHGARGELELAIGCARSWLNLDPLEEAVHRRLMRLYSTAGQRSAALRQYERCRAILGKELGEEPEEETERLREKILGRRLTH
jgi:DNA-binding SARP family transcriptional activator